MRRTYYKLTVPIVPGWMRTTSTAIRPNAILGTVGGELVDAARWPSPPHVALANWNMGDAKTARMFVTTYGPLIADLAQLPESGDRFEVNLTIVGYLKERLCRAWIDRDGKALWFPQGAENLEHYLLPLAWGAQGIELRFAGCWTYLCALLTRDLAERRAWVCKNPTCPAPYFIAMRGNNTKFCSKKCATHTAVRNFRERLAVKSKSTKRRKHS